MKNSNVIITLVSSCLLFIQVQAATLNVGPGYPYSTIQDAIDAANNGDVVLVHDGTYVENIRIESKSITVVSENGAESTIIDGNDYDHVVYFGSGSSTIEGFTIQNGLANQGGGIYCWWSSSTTITNCIITDNHGSWEGGGIYTSSSATITNCIISKNVTWDGGGIYCFREISPAITSCNIKENNSIRYGGGIYCDENSSPIIDNCTISENICESNSTGIDAGYGGGIYCALNSSVTITNSTISNNTAIQLKRDQLAKGGGIYCNATLSISNSNILNNTAGDESTTGDGGGIYIWWDATVTMNKCDISANSAIDSEGGGIYSWGVLNLDSCTISGNDAGNGGGVLTSSVVMTNCIIIDNSATASDGRGGGIYNKTGNLDMTNCFITGNRATASDGRGGGIFIWGGSNLKNCTISRNEATSGGGIYCTANYVTIVNSILWDDSPDEIDAEFTTMHITFSDIDGGHVGEGNIDDDPYFEDPANGNFHLTTDSPCINQGTTSNAPEYDFEGDPRLSSVGGDDMPDMGADEYYVPPPVPQNLYAFNSYHSVVPLIWDAPEGDSPLSYNVYRTDTPGGPYSLIASGVNRQYNRDETVTNGNTYYYVVTAVYDEGESSYSNEDDGIPVAGGYYINSGWTYTPPFLDGFMDIGEWTSATSVDISYASSVTLYVMNDNDHLYLAVDDADDTTPCDGNWVSIYFDENHNREWPTISPSGEGYMRLSCKGTINPWVTEFIGIYGWWPENIGNDDPVSLSGVNKAISNAAGHVQFEMEIDLSTSDLNASAGDVIGFRLMSSGYWIIQYPDGYWPRESSIIIGSPIYWSRLLDLPAVYGDLELATDVSQSITVTSPNGWEIWPVGSNQTITWSSTGPVSSFMDIALSTDGGSNWTSIYTNIIDDGSEPWTVPNNPSSNCLIRITDSDGHPSDTSDGLFTISPGTVTQTISVKHGRINMISFNILPSDLAVAIMLDDLETLLVAQDDDGKFYIPPYSVNTIGDVDLTNGYQVYITGSADDNVVNNGSPLVPQDYSQALNNTKLFMICYPYQNPHPVTDVFASITSSVVIVQDDEGHFWIPMYGVNTMGNMQPGKGYQIFVNQTVNFTYPTLSGGLAKATEPVAELPEPSHFQFQRTGLPYGIVVTGSEEALAVGDEVGVFAGALCVGAAVFTGNYPVVIAAWEGHEEYGLSGFKAGEAISFRVWKSSEAQEVEVAGRFTSSTESIFRGGPISVVRLEAFVPPVVIPATFALDQNYPNPFNPETIIEYQLPKDSNVSLRIYNLLGQEIRTLVDEQKNAGYHRVSWNGKDAFGEEVPSGMYLYTIEVDDFRLTRKMVRMR